MSDGDGRLSAIEIRFATPTLVSDERIRLIHDIISEAIREPENQPEGYVHWVSGCGDKPVWRCQGDQALMGLPIDPSLPRDPVEPDFDSSVFEITTTCRERRPGER